MARRVKNKLSESGERGLLTRLLPSLKRVAGASFFVPPGDDAAVLRRPPDTVLSIDGLVEDVHFKRRWSRGVQTLLNVSLGRALGWKALGSALSDLAAMGDVRDRWAMVFVGAPPATRISFLTDLSKGLSEAAARLQCRLAGGDTVRSAVLTVVAAVGGRLASARVLQRKPGRDGDRLAVIGPVGDAEAGFQVLEGRRARWPVSQKKYFCRRFFDVRPFFQEAARLVRLPGVRGGLDLSDSLHESVELLKGSSRIGATLSLDAVPVSDAYNRFVGRSPALAGWGDDYGILFSFDPRYERALRRALRFTVVGFWTRRHRSIRYTFRGQPVGPPPVFRHFL